MSAVGQAKVVRVAAASDLQPVMPAFAAAYEKETGVKVEVSFGSSSALSTQIINGGPFDVFLGADFSFPERVIAAGLAREKQPEPYAEGTLVVWARRDSPAQPLTMEKLVAPEVTKIAVADEFRAPYGRAAFATMRWMKTLPQLQPKLVRAENVAQAGQFAATGNAQAAFISLTLASSEQMKASGTYVRAPQIYPKIRQCGVVMKNSAHAEEGQRFLDWVRSPAVQNHLKDFGLEPVR